jgi:hypothetical protein
LSIMEEVRYDSAFSFCFSPRRNRAAAMGDRSTAASPDAAAPAPGLQDRHGRERSRRSRRDVEVLVEGPARGSPRLCGRTPCFKMVNFTRAGGAVRSGRSRWLSAARAHSLGEESRGKNERDAVAGLPSTHYEIPDRHPEAERPPASDMDRRARGQRNRDRLERVETARPMTHDLLKSVPRETKPVCASGNRI